MEHDALGGVHGDRVSVRDRMGDRDELDLQRTDLDGLAVGDLAHVGLREQPGFLDAVAGEAEGECGAVDRQGIVTKMDRCGLVPRSRLLDGADVVFGGGAST